MCDVEAVEVDDVGGSAGDVGVAAGVGETGKDAEVGVGDDRCTDEADNSIGKGAGKGERGS